MSLISAPVLGLVVAALVFIALLYGVAKQQVQRWDTEAIENDLMIAARASSTRAEGAAQQMNAAILEIVKLHLLLGSILSVLRGILIVLTCLLAFAAYSAL